MSEVADAVRAAVEQHSKEPIVTEPIVDTAVVDPDPITTDEPKPGRTANRLRDEHGRLLPGKAEPKEPAAESDLTTQVATEGAETPAAVPIPNSLKAQRKAEWGTLPRAWQEEIARIDQASMKGVENLKTLAKFGDEVMNEVKPYEHMILAEGGTPAAAIRDLLATASLFRRGTPEQKQQALTQIARQFNIPMPGQVNAALLEPGAEQRQPPFDPLAHPQLRAKLDKLDHLEKFVSSHFEAQERQTMESNMNAVNAFLSQVDAQGSALHPLDETLEGAFAQEIGAVRTGHPDWSADKVLQEAYENLSWKTPEIREVRLSRLDAEREAKRKAETEKALAAKRNASGSLSGTSQTTPTTGGSVRDAVVAAYGAGGGRI